MRRAVAAARRAARWFEEGVGGRDAGNRGKKTFVFMNSVSHALVFDPERASVASLCARALLNVVESVMLLEASERRDG